jgi:hypothetical protein
VDEILVTGSQLASEQSIEVIDYVRVALHRRRSPSRKA